MSVLVLGGAQTDFARNWAREGLDVSDLVAETVTSTLADAKVDTVETIHVGNAFGQLFTGQGHLGAMPATILPSLSGLPAMRHEAACASGGLAVLSAMAEIEAGRYDVALVLGVEMERNVAGDSASRLMRAAAWAGHEDDDVAWVWPHQFALVADEYDRRYGLDHAHLAAIAELNTRNARANPMAQTRTWSVADFGEDDELNPVVAGRLRRTDCSQVTDGAAGVVLASPGFAAEWARRTAGLPAEIKGWGHRTVGLPYAPKVAHDGPYLMPHVRETVLDAFRRAGIPDVFAVDGLETHDCFTSSEYLAIDHVGITQPGESWKAVEAGVLERDGALPVNPSGGLIGGGHPVGATGVRMVLDASRQVTGRAGGCQVEGARTFATLNIGGSTTTTVSFVIGV
ncbi:MAG: acetyl-CoA acetyltransferase [Actinomycetota bacterium]|nr:acetyl-CoA acetyltransferase [Actinomycetota bacterium]